MEDRSASRGWARTAVVWDVLVSALDEWAVQTPGRRLDILDLGGGTGGFAVPLARRGHVVTVLEPSPDALAALDRRVSEAGVGHLVRAVQGDAANIGDIAPAGQIDLALCHGVLEHVDDPSRAATDLRRALRPGGLASVLGANRYAVVLARAVGGHIHQARHAFDDPQGRWGEQDPVPRRFAPQQLADLLTDVGLDVRATHGVRVFSDLVPSEVVDTEPGTRQALRELESVASDHPAFWALATQIHVLAARV